MGKKSESVMRLKGLMHCPRCNEGDDCKLCKGVGIVTAAQHQKVLDILMMWYQIPLDGEERGSCGDLIKDLESKTNLYQFLAMDTINKISEYYDV